MILCTCRRTIRSRQKRDNRGGRLPGQVVPGKHGGKIRTEHNTATDRSRGSQMEWREYFAPSVCVLNQLYVFSV